MLTQLLATSATVLCLAMAGKAEAQQYYSYPTAPVYAAPVVNSYPGPVYYSQPVYAAPVYAQPVYAQPTYVQPVYAQPVYSQPYYGGYYSPLSIGLNFGFGGGRHWH